MNYRANTRDFSREIQLDVFYYNNCFSVKYLL